MIDDIDDLTGARNRAFLVVVDDTEEMHKALRFACRRAHHSGCRVALLYVIAPAEFQHWAAVGDLMREEAREEAENRVSDLADYVNRKTGTTPALFIREGATVRDELLSLLNEEPSISAVILAAGEGKDGPGPLITALMRGDTIARVRTPLTIVPGTLSDAEIDALS